MTFVLSEDHDWSDTKHELKRNKKEEQQAQLDFLYSRKKSPANGQDYVDETKSTQKNPIITEVEDSVCLFKPTQQEPIVTEVEDRICLYKHQDQSLVERVEVSNSQDITFGCQSINPNLPFFESIEEEDMILPLTSSNLELSSSESISSEKNSIGKVISSSSSSTMKLDEPLSQEDNGDGGGDF